MPSGNESQSMEVYYISMERNFSCIEESSYKFAGKHEKCIGKIIIAPRTHTPARSLIMTCNFSILPSLLIAFDERVGE
jgi:hypothetical protein